jgi:cell division protein FtsL
LRSSASAKTTADKPIPARDQHEFTRIEKVKIISKKFVFILCLFVVNAW